MVPTSGTNPSKGPWSSFGYLWRNLLLFYFGPNPLYSHITLSYSP